MIHLATYPNRLSNTCGVGDPWPTLWVSSRNAHQWVVTFVLWQGPFLIRGRDSWAGHGRVTLQKSTLVVVCVWGQRIKERFSIRMLAVRETWLGTWLDGRGKKPEETDLNNSWEGVNLRIISRLALYLKPTCYDASCSPWPFYSEM